MKRTTTTPTDNSTESKYRNADGKNSIDNFALEFKYLCHGQVLALKTNSPVKVLRIGNRVIRLDGKTVTDVRDLRGTIYKKEHFEEIDALSTSLKKCEAIETVALKYDHEVENLGRAYRRYEDKRRRLVTGVHNVDADVRDS